MTDGPAGGFVDWQLARRLAVRAAGREPLAESYHWDRLVADFAAFTPRAEELVRVETGLAPPPDTGTARARVVDRPGWIDANIASFQRLMRPLTDRLSERIGGPAAPLTRALAGVEVGTLLGWMSKRVLGQYDVLVVEDEDPDEQDVVRYVGPNILALERQFGFPPDQFRMWIALHEVTHRAQFVGIPWLRAHFLAQVDTLLDVGEPDPARLIRALERLLRDVLDRRNPFEAGGIAALVATDEQRVGLERIGGLMAVLEGHGDLTMDRAGAAELPQATRFARVLRNRRRQRSRLARVVQRVVGLEAKLDQYESGERFLEAIEAVDQRLVEVLFSTPECLPTLAEVREPDRWIDRVGPAPHSLAS